MSWKGVYIWILISVIFLFSFDNMFSEGIIQLNPLNKEGNGIIIGAKRYNKTMNQQFVDWASQRSEPENRMKVYVKKGERAYFAFSEFKHTLRIKKDTDNSIQTITAPDGTTVNYINGFKSGGYSYIPSYNESRYISYKDSAYYFESHQDGDYYFEFDVGSEDHFDYHELKIEYFDVTVVAENGDVKPGRLHSKTWTYYDNYNKFQGLFYTYGDGVVTLINMLECNFDGRVFFVNFNSYGVINTGNRIFDRKSQKGYYVAPEYEIFLDNPDPEIYPSRDYEFGILHNENFPSVFKLHNQEKYFFQVALKGKGALEIVVKSDKQMFEYSQIIEPKANEKSLFVRDIYWDGKDENGVKFENLNEAEMIVNYVEAEFHFPMYDVEGLEKSWNSGFKVYKIRPDGDLINPLKVMWDDRPARNWFHDYKDYQFTNITGTESINREWPEEIGDENTINTYWHSNSKSAVNISSTYDELIITESQKQTYHMYGKIFVDLNENDKYYTGEELTGIEVEITDDNGNDNKVLTNASGEYFYVTSSKKNYVNVNYSAECIETSVSFPIEIDYSLAYFDGNINVKYNLVPECKMETDIEEFCTHYLATFQRKDFSIKYPSSTLTWYKGDCKTGTILGTGDSYTTSLNESFKICVTSGSGDPRWAFSEKYINVASKVDLPELPDQKICYGDSVRLNHSETNILWTNGILNNVDFKPEKSAEYIAYSNDFCDRDTVYVEVVKIDLSVAYDNSICKGAETTISASGASLINIDNGIENGVAFKAQNTINYTITATEDACQISDTITQIVYEKPKVEIDFHEIYCSSEDNNFEIKKSSDFVVLDTIYQSIHPDVGFIKERWVIIETMDINVCYYWDTIRQKTPDLRPLNVSVPKTEICEGQKCEIQNNESKTLKFKIGNNEFLSSESKIERFFNSDTHIRVINENTDWCYDTVEYNVLVHSNPASKLETSDIMFCENDNVTIKLTVDTDSDFNWEYGNSNEFTTRFDKDTTIRVTVSNAKCSQKDSMKLTMREPYFVDISADKTSICKGENVTITVNSGTEFEWEYNNESSKTLLLDNSKQFTVTTKPQKCKSTDIISITVHNLPEIEIITDKDSACLNEEVVVEVDRKNNTNVNIDWKYSDDLIQKIKIDADIEVLATAINNFGCKSVAQKSINLIERDGVRLIANKDTICKNEIFELKVDSEREVIWEFETATTKNLSLNESKVFTAMSEEEICRSYDTLMVEISPLPELNLEVENDSVCKGENVKVVLNTDSEYSWTLSDNKETDITILEPTHIKASAINEYGCAANDELTINIFPQIDTIKDINYGGEVCPGGIIKLPERVKFVSTDESILEPFFQGYYDYYELDRFGCKMYDSALVKIVSVDTVVRVYRNKIVARAEDAKFTWNNCDNGDVEAVNKREFVPVRDGNYSLTVEQKGCKLTTDCKYLKSCIIKMSYLTTNGKVELNICEDLSDAEVYISSISGVVLISERLGGIKYKDLELSTLENNTYYVVYASAKDIDKKNVITGMLIFKTDERELWFSNHDDY